MEVSVDADSAQVDARASWCKPAHAGAITAVAWSRDGSLLASASEDTTVKVWRCSDASLVATGTHHPQQATAVAFSPHDDTLVSGGYDGWLKVWAPSDFVTLRSLDAHGGRVTGASFSPDGSLCATCGTDGRVLVWTTAGWNLAQTFAGPAGVLNALAWAPDGQWLAAGGDDKQVRLWNTGSWTHRMLDGATSNITGVAFSSDGRYLAASCLDQGIHLWETSTWTRRPSLPFEGLEVNAVAYAGDRVVAAVADHTIAVYRDDAIASGLMLRGHTQSIRTLAWSPKRERLASGGSDRVLRIWDLRVDQPEISLGTDATVPLSAAFSADGRFVATSGADGFILLWRTTDGALVHRWKSHEGPTMRLAFSPDTQFLAAAGSVTDPTVRLWRLRDVSLARTWSGLPSGIRSLAFTQSGEELAAGGDLPDSLIVCWRLGDGAEISRLAKQVTEVRCLAFSPDGRWLASAGGRSEPVVRLWRRADGVLERSFTGHTDAVEVLAFSPESGRVASGSRDGTARLWDVAGVDSLRVFEHDLALRLVAFDPEGTCLQTVAGGEVRLWSTSDGHLLEKAGVGVVPGGSCAVSPNGNLVFLGLGDATLTVQQAPGAPGQPRPYFTYVRRKANGVLTTEAHGKAHFRYLIEISNDLAEWRTVANPRPIVDKLVYEEEVPGEGNAGFYRAQTPP